MARDHDPHAAAARENQAKAERLNQSTLKHGHVVKTEPEGQMLDYAQERKQKERERGGRSR